jgi:hypothetical protein
VRRWRGEERRENRRLDLTNKQWHKNIFLILHFYWEAFIEKHVEIKIK